MELEPAHGELELEQLGLEHGELPEAQEIPEQSLNLPHLLTYSCSTELGGEHLVLVERELDVRGPLGHVQVLGGLKLVNQRQEDLYPQALPERVLLGSALTDVPVHAFSNY